MARALVIIILLTLPSAASAAFFFAGDGRIELPDEDVSYRDDVSPASSFESISADDAGWVSQKEKPFRGSGEPVHLWIRLKMPVTTAARRVLVQTVAWESAEYFIVRDGRLVDRQKIGTLVPWTQHTTRVTMTPIALYAGFVAVDLPPQARVTVFARVANDNHLRTITGMKFAWWDEREVRQGELSDRFFQGAFAGITLVLMLSNLFMFALNRRDPGHFYLALLMLAYLLVCGILYGLTMEFLWPDRPAWDFYCLWTASALGNFSLAQFTRHFLQADRYFPRIDVFLKWLGYTALLLLPAYLLPLATGHPVKLYIPFMGAALVSGLIMSFLVVVTILARRQRHPLVPWFAAALLFSCAGFVITIGSLLNLFPNTEFTKSAIQIGAALSGILFTLGLQSRMRQPRRPDL